MKTVNEMTLFELKTALQESLTIHKDGKIEDASSVSTSRELNPYCMTYAQDETLICSKCYVKKLEYRTALMKKCERNTPLWCDQILPYEALPFIPSLYHRFEAFADLQTPEQVVNYFNTATKNPHAHCALWTKNPFLIKVAMQLYHVEKPENLQIVYSSPKINVKREDVFKLYPFVDRVFTVYNAKARRELGIITNCMKKCNACGWQCYHKEGAKEISENLR